MIGSAYDAVWHVPVWAWIDLMLLNILAAVAIFRGRLP